MIRVDWTGNETQIRHQQVFNISKAVMTLCVLKNRDDLVSRFKSYSLRSSLTARHSFNSSDIKRNFSGKFMGK